MEAAWIVILYGRFNVPYYYGPFYVKAKATTFVEKECNGYRAEIKELLTVKR